MRTGLVLLVGTLLLLVSNAITPLQLPTALAEDFSTTVAKSRAAIALVILEQRDGSFASGTGFRVAGSSVIVTAAHVVSDAKEIVVRYADGSRYSAKPVFIWQENDVALVQVRRGPSAGLPGRKSALHVGEPALVIGYGLAPVWWTPYHWSR
jgi:S1-C subfamily serine protease